MIFHIAVKDEWGAAQQAGEYFPSQPANCPFIHLSFANQLVATANRIFRGRRDLVLLRVDDALLGSALRVESNVTGVGKFPHLYRKRKVSEVMRVEDFLPAERGECTGDEIRLAEWIAMDK